jgi:hypothetical protein
LPRSILRHRSLQKGKSTSLGRTIMPHVGHFRSFADFFRGGIRFCPRASTRRGPHLCYRASPNLCYHVNSELPRAVVAKLFSLAPQRGERKPSMRQESRGDGAPSLHPFQQHLQLL